MLKRAQNAFKMRGYAPGPMRQELCSKCIQNGGVCAEGMRRGLAGHGLPNAPPRRKRLCAGYAPRVCAGPSRLRPPPDHLPLGVECVIGYAPGVCAVYIYIYIYICSNSSGKCYFQGGMRRGYAPYIYIYIYILNCCFFQNEYRPPEPNSCSGFWRGAIYIYIYRERERDINYICIYIYIYIYGPPPKPPTAIWLRRPV